MSGWRWLLGLGALWGAMAASACATSKGFELTSVELADRAQRSPLLAQRDLAEHMITISGTVREATLAGRESVVASGWGSAVTASKVREEIPLVVLDPGTVLCYFERDQLDEIATVEKGTWLVMRCQVETFRREGTTTFSILAGCERVSENGRS